MKGKHKSKGGEVADVKKDAEDKKSEFKRGGKAEKHEKKKHGGKVEGKKSHERADKRARGGGVKKDAGMIKSAGGMTPSSPLSGAGTKGNKAPKLDKEDD